MSSNDFANRARRLVDDGQFQEAVKICRLGLLAQPKHLEGRLVLGSALVALSRFDEVLAEMRVALEIDGDSAAALTLKGEALLRKGESVQATEILERARALAPDDEDIRALYQEAAVAAASGVELEPEHEPPPGPGSEFELDRETKHYPINLPGSGVAGGPAPGPSPFEDEATIVADEEETRIGGFEPPSADDLTREGEGLEGQDERAPSPFETGEWFHAVRDEPSTRAALFSGRSSSSPETEPMPGVAPPPAVEARDERPTGRVDAHGLERVEGPTGQVAARDDRDQAAPAPPHGAASFPARASERAASAGPVGGASHVGDLPAPASVGTHPAQPAAGASARPPSSRTPSPHDDMRMIRAGLGLSAEQGAGKQGAKPEPTEMVAHERREGGPPRRSKLAAFAYVVVTAGVVAASVWGGFELRERRLAEEVEAARAVAEARAADDGFAGLRAAEAIYAEVLRSVEREDVRAALARTRAILAFEHGQGREEAIAAAHAVGDSTTDGAVASAYVALIEGRAAEARAAAESIDGWLGAYLEGQAALLSGDAEAAGAALSRASSAEDASPRALIAAASEARRRGEFERAASLLDQAVGEDPEAARWRIERARLAVARGDDEALDAHDDDLASLLNEPDDEISPRARALAGIARAEIAHARDRDAEVEDLLEALGSPDHSWRWDVAEVAAAMAFELGSLSRAEELAAHAAKAWPAREHGKLLLADVALARGELDAALQALSGLEAIGDSARALALRGRVHLLVGNLDEARADLDRALELETLREAQLSRAQLERMAGNPRDALEQLAPLRDGDDDPRLEAIFAGALRERGDMRRARRILGPLYERDDLGDAGAEVALEWARLSRASGDFDEAKEAYERVLGHSPRVELTLEVARFSIDLGEVHEASESLSALAEMAESNREILAVAGFAHALAGELETSEAYLERAEAAGSEPSALVARERGRIALLRRDAEAAVEALAEATEIDARNDEAWLLLITAHGVRGDGDAVQETVEAIVRRFGGDAVAELARGRNHLYHDRLDEAVETLEAASRALAEDNAAPRLQAEPFFWLGRVRYDLGELDDAIEALERATTLDPSHAAAHLLLGNVRFERERYEEAASAYEASLRFDRSSAQDAWFYLGDSAHRAGDEERAKEALAAYLEHEPEGDFADDAQRILDELD